MQKRRWFLETLLATASLLRLYIDNILPLIYCKLFKVQKHLRLCGGLMYCTSSLSLIHWKSFAVLTDARENCKTFPPRMIYNIWYVRSNFSMLELLEISNYSSKFLNQAHAGLWPAHTWFLKIDPVRIVGMRACVRVCVSAPKAINN